MNKVRRELPASAKCLQQRYSSKLMKARDMATLTVYQGRLRKTFGFLVFCICLMSLENLRKRNRKQWNFTTRSNVVLTWLIKWSCSVQSKQAPVHGPLLFSTTLWTWQASMYLCSIRNEQVTSFQDEVFCSSLLQNYMKTILLKDQAETLLLLGLTHYRQLLQNQSRERKQCQTSANFTQNKTSKLCFKCNKTVFGKCTATKLSE